MGNKTSRAQSKIKPNTVGSRECEKSLNSILVGINDANVTNKVLGLYDRFKRGIKKLEPLKSDKTFHRNILLLYLRDHQAKAKNLGENVPEVLVTHLLCCIKAEYSSTLRAL
jgi:hypothetical protein